MMNPENQGGHTASRQESAPDACAESRTTPSRPDVEVTPGTSTGHPLVRPEKIVGNNLVFRDANSADAAFILTLRTDSEKAKFLSSTSPDLDRQISWLENYKNDQSQIYFIILDRASAPLGTVRIYDTKGDSFCWGSWILKKGTPSSHSVESALMVYHFALRLGFREAHFDVRKGNTSVWKFHERFGAQRTAETADDYLYILSADAIKQSLERYKKYLPRGIEVC